MQPWQFTSQRFHHEANDDSMEANGNSRTIFQQWCPFPC